MMNWYLASGDLGFLWEEQLRAYSWFPQVYHRDFEFGYDGLLSLWLDYPFRFLMKLLVTSGMSWFFIEKLLWFSVFGLAFYASYRLAQYVIGKTPFSLISALIYGTNTYFLLLASGGQLGVALAYGLAPLVLFRFMTSIDMGRVNPKRAIVDGLWFVLLVSFDLRLAYLVLPIIVGYSFLAGIARPSTGWVFFLVHGATLCIISVGIHAFWILPTVLASSGVIEKGPQFTDPRILSFFSVSDFSHALSLLHPNWPENIFGKVYFMQPEFLLLPILAFGSLLYVKKRIYLFGLIALIGAFFAKGVQEPFGGMYTWLFVHVPGFVMFRDPTKFLLYVALGFSILIPFALAHIAGHSKVRKITLITAFVVLWIVLLRPVFLGQMSGKFRPIRLTRDHVRLKDALLADITSSRTLWIPKKDVFAFASERHPLLPASIFFDNASQSAMLAQIGESNFIDRLTESGVKYVFVPVDLEQRIFVDAYRYDPTMRKQFVDALESTGLVRDSSFGSVAVFVNKTPIGSLKRKVENTKKQELANVGFVISVLSLIITLSALYWFRQKKSK